MPEHPPPPARDQTRFKERLLNLDGAAERQRADEAISHGPPKLVPEPSAAAVLLAGAAILRW